MQPYSQMYGMYADSFLGGLRYVGGLGSTPDSNICTHMHMRGTTKCICEIVSQYNYSNLSVS